MGVDIDSNMNKTKGEAKQISSTTSKVKVFVIPTDEEMMIAQETLELVQ